MKRILLGFSRVNRLRFFLVVGALTPALVLQLSLSTASAALRNRYSFGEGVAADASGRTIIDSRGGRNGTVRGAGATATAGELSLPGGASATQAYVDLPNGMLTGLTDATFEAWYTMSSAQNWPRVFDFGSTTGGEITAPGGGGEGLDYIFYAPSRGTNIATQRFGMRNNDPLFRAGGVAGTVAPAEGFVDSSFAGALNTQTHVVVSFDHDGAGPGMHQLNMWINGQRAPATTNPVTTTISLANLNDVNNWLGRSNWTADANFGGSFNEFRIYDQTFTNGMAAISFANGPNGAIVPEPASLMLLVATGAGCLLAMRRKASR